MLHVTFGTDFPLRLELAIFLYRDASFVNGELTIQDLINTFAFEFGYANTLGGTPSPDFNVLYSVETDRHQDSIWLEPL